LGQPQADLDPSSWSFQETDVNGESQAYTTKQCLEFGNDWNYCVQDGRLRIQGRNEAIDCDLNNDGIEDNPICAPDYGSGFHQTASYTSGRLLTKQKVHFSDGYIEFRVKLPQADRPGLPESGIWPAVWMLGEDINQGPQGTPPGTVPWPNCGEVDIMEWGTNGGTSQQGWNAIWNGAAGTNACSAWPQGGNAACGPCPQVNGQCVGEVTNGSQYEFTGWPNFDHHDWHTYGLQWTNTGNNTTDQMTYFIDGVMMGVFKLGAAQSAFKADMFLTVNMALGGTLGGPIQITDWADTYMDVDYVRWYRSGQSDSCGLDGNGSSEGGTEASADEASADDASADASTTTGDDADADAGADADADADAGADTGVTPSEDADPDEDAGTTGEDSGPAADGGQGADAGTTPQGLTASYFDDDDLTNLKVTRIDPTINFNWGTGSPDPSIADTTYSVRWTGTVTPLYSETYTFYSKTDDGGRVWINGEEIINHWVDQAATETSGTITLVAGEPYAIEVDYYQDGGGASAQLSWSSAHQAKQIVPQSQLSPTEPGQGPPPPPPPAPSALTATAASSAAVNLGWIASPTSGVTYDLFRSTSGSFTPAPRNMVASALGTLAYSDTGLSPSTTYYYFVEAVGAAGTSGPSNEANAITQAAAASGSVLINAGGGATAPYVADKDFAGGTTLNHANAIDVSAVSNPAPAAAYQTARIANFTYTIPGLVAGSSHTVRLHFAETYFSTSGSRTFNVVINGTQVLTKFDVYQAAGAKNKAIAKPFTVTANASGQYVIQFTSVINNSLVSAIEVD
jgi:beta-glucanase (GH16 family)